MSAPAPAKPAPPLPLRLRQAYASSEDLDPRDFALVEREADREDAAVGADAGDRVAVVALLDALDLDRREIAVEREARRDDREELLDALGLARHHATRCRSAVARATTLSRLKPNCSSTVLPGAEAPKCSSEIESPWSPTQRS